MELGTWADWMSAGINGVLALAALYGIRQAGNAARDARRERDKAETALADERRRQSAALRAEFDLQAVLRIADHHASLEDPNVFLRPFERGEIIARLAALSPDTLPLTREWADAGRRDDVRQGWFSVTQEIEAELRRLAAIASQAHDGS
jgi:hypothetical protein